jgi:hypothetical protein
VLSVIWYNILCIRLYDKKIIVYMNTVRWHLGQATCIYNFVHTRFNLYKEQKFACLACLQRSEGILRCLCGLVDLSIGPYTKWSVIITLKPMGLGTSNLDMKIDHGQLMNLIVYGCHLVSSQSKLRLPSHMTY